jgi:hypothetical protein
VSPVRHAAVLCRDDADADDLGDHDGDHTGQRTVELVRGVVARPFVRSRLVATGCP